jgi:hypothetical protein
MAVAVIQEFPIDGDDRTTTNHDRVQEALGTRANPLRVDSFTLPDSTKKLGSSASLMCGSPRRRGRRSSTTA